MRFHINTWEISIDISLWFHMNPWGISMDISFLSLGYFIVTFQYFTLPLLVQQIPMDFCQTLPFLMDSADSPSESVGHDWIPLIVQPKSSESPLKPLRSKKWLDWLEFCVCQTRWTSTGFPTDRGRNQSYLLSSQSDGLPMDFQQTSDGFLSKKGTRGC